MIKFYSIKDLYTINDFKIKHRKDPVTKWIKLPCVYKIKIKNSISDQEIKKLEEIIDTIYQNKIPKPGSYTGRINSEPVNNRKTLLGNKNA